MKSKKLLPPEAPARSNEELAKKNPPPLLPGRRIMPTRQVLRFSPTAWAKLLFFRDQGNTEISGFGLTPPEDLLYVEDFLTVAQDASAASISLHDDAVADFFDAQVLAGRQPRQFSRIWCHTHPGDSPCPSGTDEETFARVFGRCEHAIMFILARGGKSYARLRFNVGPGGEVLLPVEVDYSRPFAASSQGAWKEEFKANIHPEKDLGWMWGTSRDEPNYYGAGLDDLTISDLAAMEETEQEYVLAELGLTREERLHD